MEHCQAVLARDIERAPTGPAASSPPERRRQSDHVPPASMPSIAPSRTGVAWHDAVPVLAAMSEKEQKEVETDPVQWVRAHAYKYYDYDYDYDHRRSSSKKRDTPILSVSKRLFTRRQETRARALACGTTWHVALETNWTLRMFKRDLRGRAGRDLATVLEASAIPETPDGAAVLLRGWLGLSSAEYLTMLRRVVVMNVEDIEKCYRLTVRMVLLRWMVTAGPSETRAHEHVRASG